MVICKCPVCDKEFSVFPSRIRKSKRTYCSDECRKKPFIPVQCEECGKTFLVSGQRSGIVKFCSVDCIKSRNRREEVHKNGKLITKKCERCGKNFSVRSSVAKVQRFCSQACSGYTIGGMQKGEGNPRWKPKITITCAYCSKEFETFPSRAERRKYCCKEHRILGNMQHLRQNPRTDIEIAMADALSKSNIAYDEQVVMFGKFMVDFKLKDHLLIIQCDGIYWHDRESVRNRDKGQDAYLTKAGYIVLRFSDTQILGQISACVRRIKFAIKTGQIPLINW